MDSLQQQPNLSNRCTLFLMVHHTHGKAFGSMAEDLDSC